LKESTSLQARKELVQIYLQGKSGDWQKGVKQGTKTRLASAKYSLLNVFVEIGRIFLLILAILRWKSNDLPIARKWQMFMNYFYFHMGKLYKKETCAV